jgi:hypothetical protein
VTLGQAQPRREGGDALCGHAVDVCKYYNYFTKLLSLLKEKDIHRYVKMLMLSVAVQWYLKKMLW